MRRIPCCLWVPLAVILTATAPGSAGARQASASAGSQAQAVQQTAPIEASANLVPLADEVAKQVEALRGWAFKAPVRKQVASSEVVRRYLERELEAALPGRQVRVIQAFLRTVGLIPPSCDLQSTFLALMENQVAGYYEPETKTLNLVERSVAMPAVVERLLLAHELTHALDDQYVDLAQLVAPTPSRTEDLDIVISAVTEGSATALMVQYLTRAQRAGRVNMQELLQYATEEAQRSKVFLDAPRYFSAVLASYICGMQFLARGDLMALMTAADDRAVGDNLLAACKDLPRSSEQILHPAKYWVPAERDDPTAISDAAAERWLAKAGRWIVHRDTVGEMLTAILTAPPEPRPSIDAMQTPDAWTNTAARGWDGDRFYLLASGRDADDAARMLADLRGVWVTVWDTPADRDEFVTAVPGGALPAGAAAVRMGPDGAVVFVGFDETERLALAAGLGKAALIPGRGPS